MNELTDSIFEFLLSLELEPRIIILIIAFLPIAEARLALPAALKCGLSTFQAFFYSFVGSSIATVVLPFALVPFVNFLTETKLFRKVGEAVMLRLSRKAKKVKVGSTLKQCALTAAFVAVPLPLTGVWTGSAIASIIGLGYFRSLACVTAGNFIACVIIAVITVLFSEYINLIMIAFAVIAFSCLVISLAGALTKIGKKTDDAKEN